MESILMGGHGLPGTTTYLCALAYLSIMNSNSKIVKVTPLGEEGEGLIDQFENIIAQGLAVEPTRPHINPEEKLYNFKIILYRYFFFKGITSFGCLPKQTIKFTTYDYSRDFLRSLCSFEYMLYFAIESNKKIIFVLDANNYKYDSLTSKYYDTEHSESINYFLNQLKETYQKPEYGKRRVALVLTKCERPDLWINRQQPEMIAKARFPKTMKVLQQWRKHNWIEFKCFATSAFGVIDEVYPNSIFLNREDGDGKLLPILKDPSKWKPYGIISPIYWLYTGQTHCGLQKIGL